VCALFAFEESCIMRAFLQQWSLLIAAVLVVISIVYAASTLRSHTSGVNDRLTTLEKQVESIRNALEGNQGIVVRMATLDLRVNERLQNLIAQQDNDIERNGQEWSNVQNALETLKNNGDTIVSATQRIEYLEELLLDMQASIESMKQQLSKATP
jgi:hypothetical protein